MSTAENKAFVGRLIEEVYNAGNLDAIPRFFVPGSLLAGGLAGQIRAMKTAFPDARFTIDELIAEGDTVVVRSTMRGTNSGPLVGLPAFGKLETPVPPTGKSVISTAAIVITLRDGAIASMASEIDQIGLLQQLGWSITPPGPA